MKLSYSLLGLASGQYFQTRGGSVVGLGCGVLDNCQSNQVCVVDVGFELGKCVTIPSAIQRRDEEQAPGPQTLGTCLPLSFTCLKRTTFQHSMSSEK